MSTGEGFLAILYGVFGLTVIALVGWWWSHDSKPKDKRPGRKGPGRK